MVRYKSGFSLLAVVLVVTAFQNCAPGFIVDVSQTSMGSISMSLDNEEVMRAQGKLLYEANCAACHGALTASSKLGATFDAIKGSIASVTQMRTLVLTDDEISAIQVALSPAASSDLRFTCRDSNARGLTNPAVRRMSAQEVANTVRSILGPAISADAEIQEVISGFPSDLLVSSVDEYSAVPQLNMQLSLASIAKRAVEITESNTDARSQIFGTCGATATIADSCATTFIQSFGLKSRRRPITSDEQKFLTKVYSDNGKNLKGLQSVFFVMLQAPEVVMHVEAGTTGTATRVKLNAYEVASRISYLTLASPPDALLLRAAEQGQLKTISAVKAQVTRLLSSSSTEAKARIAHFMSYYGALPSLEQPRASVGKANGLNTSGLQDQMLKELADYSDHIFWTQNGSFEELMTSRDSFPRSDAMMKILGTSAKVGTNGKPVQASAAHLGWLHRPAFLASPSERTSPILRGVHVRREVLCNDIPLPPSDEVDDKLAQLEQLENQTNRTRIAQLTESPACAGCHTQINPLGFLFEGWDQLGRPRTDERIYDDTGALVKTWAVNTEVQNPKIEPGEASSAVITDSIALTKAMSKGKTARACFAQKAFEFVRVRRLNTELDGCALREAEKKVQTGSLRDVFIESIANEDIFWRSNL